MVLVHLVVVSICFCFIKTYLLIKNLDNRTFRHGGGAMRGAGANQES